MGTGWSYITRKSTCPRKESVPLIVSSVAIDMMAEGKQRDPTRQHNPEAMISQDDFRRYSTAVQDFQELLERSGSMMERQRKLESELERLGTCNERYDRAQYTMIVIMKCSFY